MSTKTLDVNRRNFAHGHAMNGKPSTLYQRWCSMKSRCYGKTNSNYHKYGARGITVCAAWKSSFASFRDWALANGFSPELQIDRFPNREGNYEPENCRWVTCEQNLANRKNSLIFPSGETSAQVATRLGMSISSIQHRLYRGMTMREAMTTPKVPRGQRHTFKRRARQ